MSTAFEAMCGIENLKSTFANLDPKKAPGIDNMTHEDYGRQLDGNLADLRSRLLDATYEPKTVVRRYKLKPNGKRRPIGLVCVEDKIVQRAVLDAVSTEIESIFFDGCAARSGLGTRYAQDRLHTIMSLAKGGHIVCLDLQDCFGSLLHDRLFDVVASHVSCEQTAALVSRFIRAEVVDDGTHTRRDRGLEQGVPLSPLLSNLYMHYAIDVHLEDSVCPDAWVRYLDDTVLHTTVAPDLVIKALDPLLRAWGLTINVDKTQRVALVPRDAVGSPGGIEPARIEYVGATYEQRRLTSGRWAVFCES